MIALVHGKEYKTRSGLLVDCVVDERSEGRQNRTFDFTGRANGVLRAYKSDGTHAGQGINGHDASLDIISLWGHDAPTDPVPSAIALLSSARSHMEERAATYDSPEGERSMAQTVAVFNQFHGTTITEAQGWHFMQILKDVRFFSHKRYHADSAEDCVAYSALKAEAKAKEVSS